MSYSADVLWMVKGEKGAKLADMSLLAPDDACGKRQKQGHATLLRLFLMVPWAN